MSYIGKGAALGNVHYWNGTKWTNSPYSDVPEQANSEKQRMGWPWLADDRYNLSQTGIPASGSSDFTGAYFDGSELWFCDQGNSVVTRRNWLKLKADATITAVSLGVGSIDPYDVHGDGSNTHVVFSSYSTNEVFRVRRQLPPGTLLAPTLSLANPRRFAFDGSRVWISRETVITRIDSLTVPTTTNLAGFTMAEYMVFDGRYLWVSDTGAGEVKQVDPFPGTPVVVSTFAIGGTPTHIVFDGINIWILRDSTTLTRINSITGNVDTVGGFSGLTAIGYDGRFIIAITGATHFKINTLSRQPLRRQGTILAYSGGGSNFVTCIGRGSILTGGSFVSRGDQPLSAIFFDLGRGSSGLLNPSVRAGVYQASFGSFLGTRILTPRESNSHQILFASGTLTGNARLQPITTASNYWHVFNNVALGAFTITFGSSSSNVSLGTTGTHTIVWVDPLTLTFRIFNQF
jgi:hypothetical protein